MGLPRLVVDRRGLFDRADWKAQAGTVAEATIWLLGHDAVEAFDRLDDFRRGSSSPPPQPIYVAGGYVILKTESPVLRVDTIFDAGPLGLLPNAAHGHADALSVMIRVTTNWCSPIRVPEPTFRTAPHETGFDSTAAHNTVTIDDLDQADRFDVFKWVNPMQVDLVSSFGRYTRRLCRRKA